jgi:phage major head subunit gpT-like protein
MAISEQWAQLLEPGLRQIFEVARAALVAESKIPMLFNAMTSTKAAEHFLGVGAMGDWEEFKGVIAYENFDQLYKATLTHKEFVQGFIVERKLVDDDQYNIINARPRQLALSAERTREKHAASIFNNAFDSSYPGADAVELCDSAHPLSPTHTADTWGNYGTSALSYDNIVATRRLMRAFVDDRENAVPIAPDTLLVPPQLEETAWAIWRTMNKPDTADAHANFVQGFLRRVIVWDYLTDSNNWFMIDSRLAAIHLLWIDRVALEFALDPTGDYDLQARYRGYMRYSYGFSDWRWVYGHKVT